MPSARTLRSGCWTHFLSNTGKASPSQPQGLSDTSTLRSRLTTRRSARLPGDSIDRGKLPGVLAPCRRRNRSRGITPAGKPSSPKSCQNGCKTHPEALRAEIARDVASLCENENAGRPDSPGLELGRQFMELCSRTRRPRRPRSGGNTGISTRASGYGTARGSVQICAPCRASGRSAGPARPQAS